MARPGTLNWRWLEQGLRLEFELGAGSYATSLLRELFLVEDLSLADGGNDNSLEAKT